MTRAGKAKITALMVAEMFGIELKVVIGLL
jgi:hypothetical protein